jgi:hypothetical protein
MNPRTVVLSPLAKVCKGAALLLILFGIFGLLAHSIVGDNRSELVATGARPDVR